MRAVFMAALRATKCRVISTSLREGMDTWNLDNISRTTVSGSSRYPSHGQAPLTYISRVQLHPHHKPPLLRTTLPSSRKPSITNACLHRGEFLQVPVLHLHRPHHLHDEPTYPLPLTTTAHYRPFIEQIHAPLLDHTRHDLDKPVRRHRPELQHRRDQSPRYLLQVRYRAHPATRERGARRLPHLHCEVGQCGQWCFGGGELVLRCQRLRC